MLPHQDAPPVRPTPHIPDQVAAGPDGAEQDPTDILELATARVLVPSGGIGRSPVAEALSAEGLAVLVSPAATVSAQVARGGIDLVVLHGAAALAELGALRSESGVPVVVVTREGRGALDRFLSAGADDCVARGVNRAELAARVRAVLRRRSRSTPGEVLRVGPFALDLARHVFTTQGLPIHLPPKEFGLIELLLQRDGRVVGRQEALERVWGASGDSDPTTVDVHVKRLRAKLEPDPSQPRHLLTVRGLGYRFTA